MSGNSIGFSEEIKKIMLKNVFCTYAYLGRWSTSYQANFPTSNIHPYVDSLFDVTNLSKFNKVPHTNSAPDKHTYRTHILTEFLYFLTKPYQVTTHKNRLKKTILMSGSSIVFGEEIRI